MTKNEFQQWMKGYPVYLDGATGSNLIKRGMPAGACPEEWILSHKEVMLGLQREYVEAGSQIIYAPTFTSNRIKLREYGLEDRTEEINRDLVALSKEAAGEKALVAADITMTGEQLAPVGTLDFEELVDVYKEQIACVAEAGADLVVVETMMSLQESRAALIAAKEVCDLAVLVTMTFEEDGRSLFGTDAATAAVVLETLGAAAVGANCSTGPDRMLSVISRMAEVTALPLIAKPNAGLPSLDENGATVYHMTAGEFAGEMKLLVEAGASVVGGCCGTAPEYIRALREETRGMTVRRRDKRPFCCLSSERKTFAFSLSDSFFVVGERINPTGKKKLQAELREGVLDRVVQFAEEQEACGASVLDINMGMSGIDEKAMMLRALEEVTAATSLPLAIDSSHVEVIEAALRRYPGRALINSISYEKEKLEKLLPVAVKYGAMFILLPLSDRGLPENLQEKKEIISAIVEKALALGMTKEDIVVDGLVATVGADKSAALETLETIRWCRGQGLATVCGLSNISFGLPERRIVNTTFLTMAIQAGLTMAIANPSQELLMDCAFASDLLLAKDGADIRYIERMNRRREKEMTDSVNRDERQSDVGVREKILSGSSAAICAAEKLREAVLKGNRRSITELAKEALACGIPPRELLDHTLLKAINEVGELFDCGKYFLPQLIAGAEAMKQAIEYLEPLLAEGGSREDMPVIVIATVKGDIHDIGKNLVALMLRNYGFKVIDLGKDVPREKIVQTAMETKAQVIALSALMTTTMQEMRHVIAYAKEQGVQARIMIGGAVITQDYADEIEADGYSRDAAEAVKLAQRLTGIV